MRYRDIIRNIYLVSAPSSWYRAPKIAVISLVMGVLRASFIIIFSLSHRFLMQEPLKSLDLWSDKSVFLFANEMTGGGRLSIAPNTRMGSGVRGTNHRLDGWNF